MVTADFAAYAAAQREVDALWQRPARLVRRRRSSTSPMWLVLVRPHDPRICQRHLGRPRGDNWRMRQRLAAARPGRLERRRSRRASSPGRHGDPFARARACSRPAAAGRPRLRPRRRDASTAATPRRQAASARSSAATIAAASSKARSSSPTRQPVRYRARNAGGDVDAHRSLLLRPGARPAGRLLRSPRARICGSSTSSARIVIEP